MHRYRRQPGEIVDAISPYPKPVRARKAAAGPMQRRLCFLIDRRRRSGGHTLDLRHIVVTDGGRLAVVPINRDAAPRRAPDRALVFYVAPPGNSIPCLQLSRFFTGHYWHTQASQWTRKPYNYRASEREKPPLGWSAAALR